MAAGATRRCDVAIVGGGLTGAAAAYCLAREGASVTLLERGQLNRQASGQNAGSLHFQLEFRMIEHGDDLADQFAHAMPLGERAAAGWGRLGAELGGEDLEVVQDGGFMLAETEAEVDLLERKQALERRWGLETHLLGGDEARAIAPYLSPAVRAAAFCPTEGHANPRLVGPAFARAAVRRGAAVRTEAPVVRLSRRTEGWHVGLRDGSVVVAAAVLIAAGIWSGRVAALADVRLPVVPVALTMLVTAVSAPFMPHLVQHVGRRLSMKQAHAGNVLVGGGWPSKLLQRDGVLDLDALPELRLDSLLGNACAAVAAVPRVAALQLVRCWSGMAPVTADQLPLLGEVRRRPGLFVATGGAGFTLGPTLAELVSELILGRTPALPLDLYSPGRFGHLTFV